MTFSIQVLSLIPVAGNFIPMIDALMVFRETGIVFTMISQEQKSLRLRHWDPVFEAAASR